MTSIAGITTAGARDLVAAGFTAEDARRDATVIARAQLGWDLAQWVAHQTDRAPATFVATFPTLIARRSRHEPVAYITGMREFYGREFVVTPSVLIPRPETELIVEEALRILASAPGSHHVLDVGTGSGCLAITLALEAPMTQVRATDISPAAIDVARANARRLGANVTFVVADGLGEPGKAATRPFLIVSNPPYVPEVDRASLSPDVRDYEPAGALFAGMDGLDAIRWLVPAAAERLAPGGWLFMEIGAGQADAVTAIVNATPRLQLARIANDLQGIPRVVEAKRG